jgi:hypothetical protein
VAFLTLREALATNRYEAWQQLQPLRREAARQRTGNGVQRVFEGRFELTLDDLTTLYSHPGWRGSQYGGNKWLPIARSACDLRDLIDLGREHEARQLVDRILRSSHNTGTVLHKLVDLDSRLATQD